MNETIANRGRWLALTAALLGWMFDGLEMGLFPLVARPALKELMGPSATQQIGTWLSMIMAGFLVGAAVGGLFFGWLGDRVGRVRAMVWAVATYSVFSGLCAFVTAPWQLAALRLVASMGMGGEWSLGVALVMELWPRGSRPLLAGVIGAAGNVGFLLIGVLGWCLSSAGYTGWRLLLLLGAAPALLTFFLVIFVPESERWKQAAAQATKKNRIADIFEGGLARTTLLASVLATVILLGMWGSTQWIPSWADKLTDGKMPQAKSLAQISIALGAIVGCLVAAWLAQRSSRRWAYFGLCAASLASCAWLFRAPMTYGATFLVWVFVVGALTSSFFGWLPLYLPEIFPTRVRATGQGFAYNAGRILAAAGTLGSGQLLNRFHEDYAQMCAVISLVYVVGMVVVWFCPETKGKPLPE